MTTAVVLVRHGRTVWHHPNRYAGRSDVPLDAHGEAQAEALARWAAGEKFTSLASSPLRRAVATLAPVAAVTGLAPTVEPRLRELDFGVAEGRTLDQVRADDPEAVAWFEADPAEYHFPDGEPPAEAVDRARAALADLVAADPGGKVLVVAHNTLIRLVTCAVLGVPLGEYRRRLPVYDSVAATTLRYHRPGGPAALLAYNVPVAQGWMA
ncbi:histidine phosphatase family protein [Micromonospora sp. CPCC 205371]|nr:histidine phosphatase family protein [Micromonospora sp. CPCC 205371]